METSRRTFLGTVGVATVASAMPRPATKGAVRSGPRFYVPVVTPCGSNGKFDEALYRDILSFVKQRGADGVLVAGTTGEFPSFSIAERKRIAEVALKHKIGLEMIVQVGTTNLPETLELLNHATANGADSALVIPPFYYKNPRVPPLTKYFSQVLDASKIPVYLYHIPGASAVPITPELLHSLEQHPNLAGIKDSSGNAEGYKNYIKEFPKLTINTGTDNNLQAALEGGMGAVLATGNLFARQIAAVFAAHRQGQDLTEPLAKLRAASQVMRGAGGGLAAIKYAFSGLGLRESYVRPPQMELTAEQKTQLKDKMAQLKELTT